MEDIKYWVFKHKPGKNAGEEESFNYVLQAVRNNYAFMQYEYGMQDTGKVTQNWNKILDIKKGDVIFLRGDERIYAFGHVIHPRLQADIELNAKEIIRNREHGKYNSSEYKGIIHFSDSDVFYENLEGEEQWGQRIDVDSWQLYYANGIPAKSQDLYQQGENEYGVLKELKPEKGIKLINELYKYLGMKSIILDLLKSNHNIILTGAPGTGKTYLTKQIARLLLFGKSNEEELNEMEQQLFEQQYSFVQFHPSYDYTDFVEGLRPYEDEKGNVGFKREDGIFMKFCRKALDAYNKAENKEEAPKYVFVIDEINRGDISKIFGELFFSIDPGYRGEKGKVKTQYSNLWKTEKYGDSDSFYIPQNVYIIGTMNDIDRSVESMDFAMRRRFAFKEVRAEDNMDMLKTSEKLLPHFGKIEERMTNLNRAILTIQGLSTAYQIGPAYFLKLENYLSSDGELGDGSWESLWDNHLNGLLFEYLRGLPNAEEDLETLKSAYKLADLYKIENGKVIKEPSQNA